MTKSFYTLRHWLTVVCFLSLALSIQSAQAQQTITYNANENNSAGIIITSGTNPTTLTISTPPIAFGGGIATQSGTISESGGSYAITKTGTGTLILTASNTYTGATTISNGTLQFDQEASLYDGQQTSWTGTNISVSSGATLAVNVGGPGEFNSTDVAMLLQNLGTGVGGFASGSTIGFDTTNASGGIFNYGATITNTNSGSYVLGLAKLGSGTLTLTGNNAYTGDTIIQAGTLAIGGSGQLGSGSYAGNIITETTYFSSSPNPAGSFSYGSTAAQTLSGIISGAGSLIQNGIGTLTLSGTNTFTGSTTVNAGALVIASGGSIASSSGVTLADSGTTFDISGSGNQLIQNLNGVSGSTVNIGANTLSVAGTGTGFMLGVFAGTIQGTGGLIVGAIRGNGLNLGGDNTYTGDTLISASSYLQLGLGNGGGSTTGSIDGNIIDNGQLFFDRSNAYTFNGVISGSGEIFQRGSGTLTLAADNTGTFSIFPGTGIAISAANNLGSVSSIIYGGGILETTASFTNGHAVMIDFAVGSPMVFQVDAGVTTTQSGLISDVNSGVQGGVSKTGAGTLILTAANTYNGATTVNSGILQFANTNAMPASGTVTVSSGATLAINAGGSGEFTNATSGNGSIGGLLSGVGGQGSAVTFSSGSFLGIDTTNAGGSLTYSGNITNAGLGLVKLGTGTLILSGTNTYTGGTSVLNGNLAFGSTSSLGSGGVSLANGGVVQYTGTTSGTLNQNITVTSGTAAVTNTGSSTLTLNGTVTKTGSTFSVTGNVNVDGVIQGSEGGYDSDMAYNHATSTVSTQGTYFGATHIFNTSTVTNGVNEALPSTAGAASANTTLIMGDASETSGQINVYALGGFTQTLAGITSTSGTGTDSNQIIGGATTTSLLTLNIASGTDTYSGLLGNGVAGASNANNLSLTKSGTSTLNLSGPNTYIGGTTVSAGTLLANNTSGSATGTGTVTVNGGASIGGSGTSSGTNFSISGSGTTTGARANVLAGMNSTSDTNVSNILTLKASSAGAFQDANLTFNLNSAVAGGLGTDPMNSGTELSVGSTAITFGSGLQATILTLNLQGASPIASNTPYVLIAGLTAGGVDQYSGLLLGTSTGSLNTGLVTPILNSGFGGAGNLTLMLPNAGEGLSYLFLYQNSTTGVDDIEVEMVPEPSTWAMVLGGLLFLCFFVRSRRGRSLAIV